MEHHEIPVIETETPRLIRLPGRSHQDLLRKAQATIDAGLAVEHEIDALIAQSQPPPPPSFSWWQNPTACLVIVLICSMILYGILHAKRQEMAKANQAVKQINSDCTVGQAFNGEACIAMNPVESFTQNQSEVYAHGATGPENASRIVMRDSVGNFSASGTTIPTATATALAANAPNCAASKYALGVNSSGAAESCLDVAATPSTQTISGVGGTATATALAVPITDETGTGAMTFTGSNTTGTGTDKAGVAMITTPTASTTILRRDAEGNEYIIKRDALPTEETQRSTMYMSRGDDDE